MTTFQYEHEEIVQKILESDEEFLSELIRYLQVVQIHYICKTSNMLTKEDFDEISEDVMCSVLKDFAKTDVNLPFESFLKLVYKRHTVDYISKKTGISRLYYRTIKTVKELSEQYNIPINRDNYYKFHRLSGIKIQTIEKALQSENLMPGLKYLGN